MRKSAALVALSLILLAAPSFAATELESDSQEILNIDVKQALTRALETNLTVLSAQEDLEAAKGRSKANSAALNPSLTVGVEADAADGVPNTPNDSLASRVGLSQTLYAGGKNKALAKQGKLGIEQYEQLLEDTRESVAQTVWNAFYDVLYRMEVVRNANEALEYYTSAERDLRQRVIHGLSTNLDLTRVRQQRENARAEHITASNDLQGARIELCRLLRMAPDTKLAIVGNLEDGLPTIEESRVIPEDIPARLEKILEQRSDYQALKRAEEIQRKEVTVARSGMKPTLSLSGGYRFGYHEDGYDSSTAKDQWTAALALSVPLYDGGLTSGNVRAAKAGLNAASNAVKEKEESIVANLADSWLTLQNALETVSAGRVNLQFAVESLAYAEAGYREGVNTQLDVIQARSELTDAHQTLAQYLLNARQAQANFWKDQGRLVENALAN